MKLYEWLKKHNDDSICHVIFDNDYLMNNFRTSELARDLEFVAKYGMCEMISENKSEEGCVLKLKRRHSCNPTRQIALIWDIEDVQKVAPYLNDNEAFCVLQDAKLRHDANMGVNWEVLELLAGHLYPIIDKKDENEMYEHYGKLGEDVHYFENNNDPTSWVPDTTRVFDLAIGDEYRPVMSDEETYIFYKIEKKNGENIE